MLTTVLSVIVHCCLQASEMACKTLQDEDLGEDEVQPAPKLLEVILQNCRGHVDDYLPHYIQAGPLPHGDVKQVDPIHMLDC